MHLGPGVSTGPNAKFCEQNIVFLFFLFYLFGDGDGVYYSYSRAGQMDLICCKIPSVYFSIEHVKSSNVGRTKS